MDEQAIRDAFEGLGRGDIDAFTRHLADDVVLEFPGRRFGGRFEGSRKAAVFLKRNQRLFDGGLHFTVHWAARVGDRAVAQWTNAGTTREGKPYANRGVTIFRFEGERVAEIQDYLDTEQLSETWPA
jgi:ketosteroid isomerase-like protein